MATLPRSHPVTEIYREASKRKVKRHKSPLHCIASAFEAAPEDFESTTVARRNSALIGKQPFKIEVPGNKDDSKSEDENAPEHIKIYADGSMHDGYVGAAAVLTRNGETEARLLYHLGSASDHTGFEVELIRILMDLHLIEKAAKRNITFALGADNQFDHIALVEFQQTRSLPCGRSSSNCSEATKSRV
jgi:hypothetical protein